jgi:hypothetical protein
VVRDGLGFCGENEVRRFGVEGWNWDRSEGCRVTCMDRKARGNALNERYIRVISSAKMSLVASFDSIADVVEGR